MFGTWQPPGVSGSNGVAQVGDARCRRARPGWCRGRRSRARSASSCSPCRASLWYWRTSLSADSTASLPPLVKNTRFRSPGVSDAIRAASSIDARVRVGPVREEAQLAGLVGARLGDVGAAVADVHAEQRREPVEVALAVLVVDVAALAPTMIGTSCVVEGADRRVKCIQRWRLANS